MSEKGQCRRQMVKVRELNYSWIVQEASCYRIPVSHIAEVGRWPKTHRKDRKCSVCRLWNHHGCFNPCLCHVIPDQCCTSHAFTKTFQVWSPFVESVLKETHHSHRRESLAWGSMKSMLEHRLCLQEWELPARGQSHFRAEHPRALHKGKMCSKIASDQPGQGREARSAYTGKCSCNCRCLPPRSCFWNSVPLTSNPGDTYNP